MILKDSIEAHRRARKIIREGGVIAFRTDTFYGLGADPFNVEALRRILNLKGREEGKPILVVISEAQEAERFISSKPPLFDALSSSLWPGAITLVADARPELPHELTAGTSTVGVRLPDDASVRALVRACEGALTATSANLSGEPPARTASEVARSFPEGLSLIVDGGDATCEQPSTVLRVSGEGSAAHLLREGAVTRSQILLALEPLGAQLL